MINNRVTLPAAITFIITGLVVALYLPFLKNGLVFDDHAIFSTLWVYEHAQIPFDFRPRTFPYFTLGLVQVEFGTIEAQRLVNLALHLLCALTLLALLTTLLRQTLAIAQTGPAASQQETKAIAIAAIGATWFALNPVAVYGTGYLVQRTILFATLFSLLSLWFYRRAFAQNRTADVVTAALFYSAAVFSKEHAVMLPLAAVPLAGLYEGTFRAKRSRIALFLLFCLPAACVAIFASKAVVASSYEPYVGSLFDKIQGIPLLASASGKWLVSVLMQAGFFFDYVAYWIVPDVRTMSIDMRIDFARLWSGWWLIPKALLFFLSPLCALFLMRRRGLGMLFGCGLLYSWLLFLTEVVTVRFQEPFVLYRSYLWAPGYVLMAVTAFSAVSSIRRVLILSVLVIGINFSLAQERLQSLVNEGTAWNDAGAKLQSTAIVGASRILYMRGREYIKEKKYEEAIKDFTRVILYDPAIAQAYYQRGIAFYSTGNAAAALKDFSMARTLNAKDGSIAYAQGIVYEGAGCREKAINAYTESLQLGIQIATIKIHDLSQREVVIQQKEVAGRSCPY